MNTASAAGDLMLRLKIERKHCAMIRGNLSRDQKNKVNVNRSARKETSSPNVLQLMRLKVDEGYTVKDRVVCPGICGVCCYWPAAPLHHLGIQFQYRAVTSAPFPSVVLVLVFPSFSRFPRRLLTLSLCVMPGTVLRKFVFHHASAYTGVNEPSILFSDL